MLVYGQSKIDLHFRRGTGRCHCSRHSLGSGGSRVGSTWERPAVKRRPSSRIFLWQKGQYHFRRICKMNKGIQFYNIIYIIPGYIRYVWEKISLEYIMYKEAESLNQHYRLIFIFLESFWNKKDFHFYLNILDKLDRIIVPFFFNEIKYQYFPIFIFFLLLSACCWNGNLKTRSLSRLTRTKL